MKLSSCIATEHIPNKQFALSICLCDARQTELASYLADFTLATDTAAGALALQNLAEEHHCGATLTVEPYEGLRKVRQRAMTIIRLVLFDNTLIIVFHT